MKTITKNGVKAVEVSGNLFAEFGSDHAEEKYTKTRLCIQIKKIIQKRKLTQQQAAEILGIKQPVISRIYQLKIDRFTIGKLTDYLIGLDCNVELHIKPKRKGQGHAHYSVYASI